MAPPAIVGIPRARPIVEIGVGSVNEPAGVGTWQSDPSTGPVVSRWQPVGGDPDGNTWVGRDPYWWDITCDVLTVGITVGRERSVLSWNVGTASVIVRNATGWADFPPPDPAQTFLTVRPGRPIRVGVSIDDGDPQYLWGGYIDSQAPGFDAEEGETVTLDCIDAKGDVGRSLVPALTAAVGAGDTATGRITRVLNAVHWPSWRRDLAVSTVPLEGTVFDAQVVDLVNLAADSVGGAVFGTPDGAVAFRNRDWQIAEPGTPVDATIANFGIEPIAVDLVEDPVDSRLYLPDPWAVDAGDGLYEFDESQGDLIHAGDGLFYVAADTAPVACPTAWEIAFSREDISTKVVVARTTDTAADPPIAPVVREDVTARTMFGDETFERRDLETLNSGDLGALADRILEVRSWEYMPRIAAVTLNAATAPEVVDVLAAADPYKPARFNARHQAANGRIVFSRTMIVVGVEHEITPESWIARIALDDAAPYTAITTTARWSDGVADTARWDLHTWGRAA